MFDLVTQPTSCCPACALARGALLLAGKADVEAVEAVQTTYYGNAAKKNYERARANAKNLGHSSVTRFQVEGKAGAIQVGQA